MKILANFLTKKKLTKAFLVPGLLLSCLYFEGSNVKNISEASGIMEFRWNQDGNYKKLKFLQGSDQRLDRSTYFFFLRRKERQTAILKLSYRFPDYFKATLKPKNISLCKVKIGGYSGRTKCVKNIPAVVEIDESMRNIDVYPNTAIPADKNTYALKLKMFNPRKRGFYQINAFSQSPGDLPVSLYLGSYLIEIQ